ncbi:NAD(P)/FAD-dependent oxidoreductase, partial [Candidatus Zixiibacteriota bacterium]
HKLRFFISEELGEDQLVVRPPSHYREQNIRLRLGQEVQRVDLQEKTLYLKHMEKVHYTRLLLCSGGWPRIPEIHYPYRQHFTILKGLSHARGFREQISGVDRVLMVGGDLVSLKITETLLDMGREVLFMIDRDSFWPLTLTDDIRDGFAERLSKQGAEVITDDEITGIEKGESGYEVMTRHDRMISCDLVGAFFGLVPNVDFLFSSGLDIDRGILVDDHLQASDPDVWAAGDCAQIWNPAINNYWVSIGWENARILGEVAARNMLGESATAGAPKESALEYEGIKVNTSWWQIYD